MLDRATTTPSISCVMPAYNEAGNLGRFVPQVLEALRALSPQVEVVIVNDGSRDQTAAAAIELTRQHPEVVLIDLSRNFGKEAALTAGMEAARGEVVILMDSDGQHPVSLMAQMLQRWREGMDVVYAVRKTRDDQTRLHANLAGLFYTLVNHNNRVKIPPNAGDFRLMDRAVVEAIKTLPERNRFMKGLYAWVGFNSTALEYEPLPRTDGQSSFGLRSAASLALTGLVAFSSLPLRALAVVGLLISLASLSYGLWVVVSYFVYGIDVPGYATLAAGMMLLSGIQILSIGVLAEYIGRIYEEVKRRPTYLMKARHGQGLPPPQA
ncbi:MULTISPECIES: glycosyltransferase family 2 protein [Curvibacter]|jgi:glycosyltransferase involved in cell wall biosynthesis|uniref:glycosyltransferase family 2 protein n=1 Tax=Curvibacter TaxID=281915 RepID=UPI0003A7CA8F|nr:MULTISPECIES: glycosyltransferase family 2 protein [Curvibacter]MBV5296136.1 glycosyltransferase family 2 protein [Curvibacter lanceolatus]